MATIANIEVGRDSRVLNIKFDVRFSDKEQELNLIYWPTVALYERDGTLDKVFFWNNGGRVWVHSINSSSNPRHKDDYIGFFDGGGSFRPNGRAQVSIEKTIDLDDPDLRENVRRADDPHTTVPTVSAELWEEPVAFIHLHNELSPSTWSVEYKGLNIDFG